MNIQKIFLTSLILLVLVVAFYFTSTDSNKKTLNINSAQPVQTENLKSDFPQATTAVSIEKQKSADVANASSTDQAFTDADTPELPNANLEQLKQYIEKNDLCSLKKLKYSILDLARVLTSTPKNANLKESDLELINELISTDSAILKGNNPVDGNHPVVRFYYALYLADLIAGNKTQNQKYNTANDILLDLSKVDPSNGAYTYYRAYVLSKLNAPEEQIKDSFVQAFKAERFDAHLETIMRILYEQSLSSPAHYAAGNFLVYSSAIPEINEPLNLLRIYIKKNDSDFNNLAEKFSEKISNLSQFKKGSIEFVHYSLLQIMVGQSIKRAILKLQNPDKPMPERISTKQVTEKISPNQAVYRAFVEEVLKDCSSPKIYTSFENVKKEYTHFLNSK